MRRTLKFTVIGCMFGMSFLALSGCVAGTGEGGSGREGPGIVNGGLVKGRGYFMRECNKCHRYFMPSERSADAWPKILESKKNKVSLTGTQFQQLSEYVIQESRSPTAQP